jgi:nicotinamide mononucleotide transporter
MSIPIIDTRPAPPLRIFRNDFFLAGLIAVVATTISYLVGISLGWLSQDVNWFEVGAVGLNYASFYLSVKRRRMFYMVGAAASALFIVTYLQANLLASAFLSAYLAIALFVGWYMWGKDSKPKLRVEHIKPKLVPLYLLVTALAFGGAYLGVTILGGSFAPFDSLILVSTLLAQFMLDRKKLENWWVWIIGVNLAGTILYFVSGLYFAAIQQLVFGIASVWGWFEWYGVYKREKNMDRHPAGKYRPKVGPHFGYSETGEWMGDPLGEPGSGARRAQETIDRIYAEHGKDRI